MFKNEEKSFAKGVILLRRIYYPVNHISHFLT